MLRPLSIPQLFIVEYRCLSRMVYCFQPILKGGFFSLVKVEHNRYKDIDLGLTFIQGTFLPSYIYIEG